MNRCRKCGADISGTNKKNKPLWCGKCRIEVDRELRGEQNEGFDYYFIYYQESEGKWQGRKTLRG